MNNIAIYKQVSKLKDYLEIHEWDNVNGETITKCIYKINEIFALLERRKEKRAK